MDSLAQRGLAVDPNNYAFVYSAPLQPEDTLDGIFQRFNLDRPADFTGHSLSVSDVVMLNKDGKISSHYVDSFGFVELPAFLGMEQQLAPELSSKDVPVYKHSAGVARQNDELEAYRNSRKLNIACGEAIDQAIKENSTPGPSAGAQYVDSAQAARSVIAEFGAERVAWVLAANIQAADWDGRFSNSTKAWAHEIETSGKPDVYLNTHRSILDGFVQRFREVEQEQPSIAAALSAGAEKSRRAFGNAQSGMDAPKKSTEIEV